MSTANYQRPKPGPIPPGCTYVRPGSQPAKEAEAIAPANRHRVPFFADSNSVPVTSLWVEVVEGGVVLEREYPDFKPVGMLVEIGGKLLKVAKQTGRQLTLEG